MNKIFENQLSIIDQQIKNGVPSHAYLFISSDAESISTFTRAVCSKLLKTDKLDVSLDYKKIDIDGLDSVIELRNTLSNLSGKPIVSEYRVVVFENFEKATTAQSNAMLKFIEDAPKSLIVVLVAKTANILPTVISRCQTFYLNSIAHQFETSVHYQENKAQLMQIESLNAIEKSVLSKQLSELTAEQLSLLCLNWIVELRAKLGSHPKLYKKILTIVQSTKDLNRSVNKKMVIDQLIIQ